MASTDQVISRLVRTLSSYFRFGAVRLKDNSGVVQLRDATDSSFADGGVNKIRVYGTNASNSVNLAVAGGLGASLTLTLPSADGATGAALTTDGAGTLSFTSLNAVGINVQTEAFTEATSSPLTIFTPPANATILRVIVKITAAAAGGSPTLDVGVSGTVGLYMANTDIDVSTVGTYTVEPNANVGGSPSAVILTIVPSAQTFTGAVYVEYGNAG